MENHIYHLVGKFMEIFEVSQPALGQKWAQQLIESARRPAGSQVKPVNVSLEEIQSYRGNNGIRDLYNELKRFDGGLRGADGILHLASNLGRDDGIRKFIKIHNLLRESKAKKQQQQMQQQRQQQQQEQQNKQPESSQQTTLHHTQVQHKHHVETPQRPQLNLLQQASNSHQLPPPPPPPLQPIHQQPQAHQYQQHQPPQPPANGYQTPATTRPTPHATTNRSIRQQIYSTPLQNNAPIYETPRPERNSSQHAAYSTPGANMHANSMVLITPANYKQKREKSRKSEKEMRRKNDILYQKMKSFLAENTFLSFDFKKIDWTQMPPIAPLSSMTVQEQESALINDLLYVLIGTEGKYIRMQPSRDSPNKHTIGVERGGDELVYTSATRIIKICPLYSTVVHYAEDVNFGLVNQALAAPIRELVKEYLSLISNLQMRALRDEMTLQSMWLSLQTIFYRMEALKQILDQISRNSCYGGHTLSVLHNRVINFSTDPRTHEFCVKLMQAASEPYFEILENWLYLGVIEDPYGEFFIDDTENKESKNFFSSPLSNNRANINRQTPPNVDIDTFWRKRFTRDDFKVPEFLKFKQEKIFETGKHLSVVRQYGKKAFKPLRYEPLQYCTESRIYDERIDEAYRFANKELLDLLLVENKLIDRLYSLKRYFLFSSGDFFVQFMDMADEELSRTKDDIVMTRLGSLLELALRTSSCNIDPYKDDVHIKMSDGSLFQIMASINSTNGVNFDDEQARAEYCHSSGNLLGWESLTLSYDVPWPLSMIICKDYCQTLYQMMFRHLFCCKYIERKLEMTGQISEGLNVKNPFFTGAFSLRQRMLHFAHNLLNYIIEIIEPSFQILIGKFKDGGVENVNEVIELHRAFLSGLVHDSMLTDNELLGHVTKLLLLCMDFSVVMETTMPEDRFQLRIYEITCRFNSQLMILLNAITERSQDFTASSKLQNIFYRLDFNNFYTKVLAS